MYEGEVDEGGTRGAYVDGLFGVCFLDDADDCVGNEDEKDDCWLDESTKRTGVGRVLEEGEEEGDGGGREENEDELVLELV